MTRWLLALITAEQFRQHFPNVQGTGEDATFDLMIARADSLMAVYCGFPRPDAGSHTLEDVTYTRYPSPKTTEPRALDLRIRHVVSITSAHIDENWSYGSSTAVATGDRVLDGDLGVLWLTPTAGAEWSTSPRANKVVLVAGFTTTPPDLVAIAATAARHLLDVRRTHNRQQQSQAGMTVTLEEASSLLPKSVRDLLDAGYVDWRTRAA